MASWGRFRHRVVLSQREDQSVAAVPWVPGARWASFDRRPRLGLVTLEQMTSAPTVAAENSVQGKTRGDGARDPLRPRMKSRANRGFRRGDSLSLQSNERNYERRMPVGHLFAAR